MFDYKNVYPAMNHWLTSLAKDYLTYIREEHAKLMQQHRSLTGGECYLVGGSIFGPGGARPVRLNGLKPLPPQLVPQHEEWLALCNQHGLEWSRAAQVLRTAFSRTQCWQDVRDIIPDHVLRTFPAEGLMNMERTRPDLYAGFKEDPSYAQERALREHYWEPKLLDLYEQVAPTINLYVSYRLL